MSDTGKLEPYSFSVGEAAALLGVSRQTVRHWLDGGKLTPFKVGRTRVARSEIEALLGQPVDAERIFAAQQRSKARHRAERKLAA